MKVPWEKVLLGVVNHAGAVFKRDNAVIPMNALALLGAVVCFSAAFYLPAAAMPLVIAGISLLGLAATAYFILLFRDPDRLQSEKYQLAQARMEQVLVAKELSRPLTSSELSPPSTNPALPPPEWPEEELR